MKLLRNTGSDRVVDLLNRELIPGRTLDVVTPLFSLFGFAALRSAMTSIGKTRMILPSAGTDLMLLGETADRAARNRLQMRWLAQKCEAWLRDCVDLRLSTGPVPQGTVAIRDATGAPQRVIHGAVSLTTAGLGVT
ncbi:MAG: helicase, partial [Bdellovibrionota bacterium]